MSKRKKKIIIMIIIIIITTIIIIIINNKKNSLGLTTMEFIITVYLDMSVFIQESLITNTRLIFVLIF